MSENILQQFARALSSGEIRVVDLSQPLEASTAVIQLPPEFGKSWPFQLEEISKYDSRGPGVVLEQLLLRRTHRHAFRRADSLGDRQRLSDKRDRYHLRGKVSSRPRA